MTNLYSAGHSGKQNIKRDAPVTCDACGRRVARKSRQQKFCSDRCRDYARRENKARTAIKNSVLGQDTGQPTNPHFLSNKNNSLHGTKSGSSIPLNVLGGYRWPNAPKLDRRTWANVIRREIGGVS
jgi:predicted nucleic acid-binding Zn ribbon protein